MRGQGRLECEGAEPGPPALSERPSPRLWKNSGIMEPGSTRPAPAACAQTLRITRGARLAGWQRRLWGGQDCRAPGLEGAPPSPRASNVVPEDRKTVSGPQGDGPTCRADAPPWRLLAENVPSGLPAASYLVRVFEPRLRRTGDTWRKDGEREGGEQARWALCQRLPPPPSPARPHPAPLRPPGAHTEGGRQATKGQFSGVTSCFLPRLSERDES